VEKSSEKNVSIVIGDFNAKIGSVNLEYEEVMVT